MAYGGRHVNASWNTHTTHTELYRKRYSGVLESRPHTYTRSTLVVTATAPYTSSVVRTVGRFRREYKTDRDLCTEKEDRCVVSC